MRGNKSAPKESDTTYNERLSIPPPIEVPDKNSLCVNVFAVYVRAVAVDIASVADGWMAALMTSEPVLQVSRGSDWLRLEV